MQGPRSERTREGTGAELSHGYKEDKERIETCRMQRGAKIRMIRTQKVTLRWAREDTEDQEKLVKFLVTYD